MQFTKEVKSNNGVLYISIPQDVANNLNIKEGQIIVVEVIKIYKKEE